MPIETPGKPIKRPRKTTRKKSLQNRSAKISSGRFEASYSERRKSLIENLRLLIGLLLSGVGGWILISALTTVIDFYIQSALLRVIALTIGFLIVIILVVGLFGTSQKMSTNLKLMKIKKKEKYPKESIIQIMNKKKSRDVYITVILCLAFLLLSVIIPQLNSADMYYIRIVLSLAVILLLAGKLALEYRILKGWYGNNEHEAREIIEFIIRESSNIDFRDGGKLKKILSDKDLEEIRSIVFRPVPGTTD